MGMLWDMVIHTDINITVKDIMGGMVIGIRGRSIIQKAKFLRER